MKVVMFDLDGTLIDRQGLLFDGNAGRDAARRLTPEPSVHHLLAAITQHVRVAVVTNGSSARQRLKLRCSGLEPFVGSLTVSGEVGVAKPNRGIFLRACRDARCSLQDVLMMVGDDPVCDIGGAAAAGIPTCWVARGRTWRDDLTAPTRTVESVLQMVEVLRCSMLPR